MTLSRRRLVASGVALLLAPACKSEPKLPASCSDTSGLKPEEAQVRTELGYLDRGTDPQKSCGLCQQYLPVEKDGGCGACKLLKGTVHPLGSCNAFARKA